MIPVLSPTGSSSVDSNVNKFCFHVCMFFKIRFSFNRDKCLTMVYQLQKADLALRFGDIAPNFVVGGKGWIFEGRGANVVGHLASPYWNQISITIQFLGKYIAGTPDPDDLQYEHINILLDKLVEVKALKRDYTLFGHCQKYTSTVSPGINIVTKLLPRFKHWDNSNYTDCLPGYP